MANIYLSCNILLPSKKCMKCRVESTILLSASFGEVFGCCDHKFCQSCFRKANEELSFNLNCIFKCSCCRSPFYGNIPTMDEAILIGEAATIRDHIFPLLSLPKETVIPGNDVTYINQINFEVMEKAIQLNSSNFYSLYLLFRACSDGNIFLIRYRLKDASLDMYRLKLFEYSYKLLDHPAVSGQYDFVRGECFYELACTFNVHSNHAAALKYSKLAYEHCLRSSNHTQLSIREEVYLKLRALSAELPPLRFAVGDEVEFLHELELETGSEWRLGKVVELQYREQDFAISFSAPYRMQLLEGSSESDSLVFAWVKADIDRYVRKRGVRSIEDTRYQTRLDAKIEELARVYCYKEFIQDIYSILAQHREFVEMLQSVWHIELSYRVLSVYHMFVMFRQPLIRTDTGYRVPTAEEVITGIRAYFDPCHLSSDATSVANEGSDSQQVRAESISMLRSELVDCSSLVDDSLIQVHLLRSIRNYFSVLVQSNSSLFTTGVLDHGHDFFVPLEVSDAISKVSTTNDLKRLYSGVMYLGKLGYLLNAWIGIHIGLASPEPAAGSPLECPFVYFFVKFCLDQQTGVPKLALALYDRMNMQLSREFIRCANPTCELNKLDKSTGKVKFKNCSRCKAVIYCSRECQVAHYPEHKRLCSEHSTGQEGS